jgi:hypothetical protein
MRIQLAGSALRYKGALVHLKGDWEEFCARLGFPTWQSSMRPCFCCAGSGSELFQPAGVSFASDQWHMNTDDEYTAACARCEVWVDIVDAEHHAAILNVLHFDKRADGSRGRSLRRAVPPLLIHDRLEPNPTLPDVGDFDLLSVFPHRVLFWRRTSETICTHRCPLFDASIGVTPTKTVAIDIMHTLFLGPMLVWCRVTIWALLQAGIWGVFESTVEEQLVVAIMAFRAELFAWYATERLAGRIHTQIENITRKMIGTAADPHFKLKAMEAYGCAQFLVHALGRYRARCRPPGLIEAGASMVRLVEFLKNCPWNMRPAALQDRFVRVRACARVLARAQGLGKCRGLPMAGPWRGPRWAGLWSGGVRAPRRSARKTNNKKKESLDLWKRHMSLMMAFGVFVPKHHLMFHLLLRAVYHGNPWQANTFYDESLNKQLKGVARLCHQCTFESTAIIKVTETLKRRKRGFGDA